MVVVALYLRMVLLWRSPVPATTIIAATWYLVFGGIRSPSYTRHHPLIPTTAPGSPAVPCSEYTHALETKEEKILNVPNSGENEENRSGK